jgi:UDP-N-acetylglucosamine 2-epimerase
MKTIVTISGIRPDFIRMSEIFKKLDSNFNHILIHTGQHYDTLLSDVFFEDLEIRKPDYILNMGKESTNHFEQLGYLSVEIPKLLKTNNINPDLIVFLGDSNTVSVSFPLKKEGYKICHIEAGMRSFDRRMMEEINRTVCDHCSDILFVYHDEYKKHLYDENVRDNVFVVGNTIIEPCLKFKSMIDNKPKLKNVILVDIHRPENFNYPERLKKIIDFCNACHEKFGLPVKILYFKRLRDMLDKYNISLGNVEMIGLMSYKNYLQMVYDARFVISDSGTAAEELPLLGTPLFYPRDFTERPQSYEFNCSIKYDVEGDNRTEMFEWLEKYETGVITPNVEWLGDGQTSDLIIGYLKYYLDQ